MKNDKFIVSYLDWGIFVCFIVSILIFISNFETTPLPSGQASWNYYVLNRGLVLWHEHAVMGVKLGIICYGVYSALILFVRWITAWKPTPKFIQIIAKILLLILVCGCILLMYGVFYQSKSIYFSFPDTDTSRDVFLTNSIHSMSSIVMFFSSAITIVVVSFFVYIYKKNHAQNPSSSSFRSNENLNAQREGRKNQYSHADEYADHDMNRHNSKGEQSGRKANWFQQAKEGEEYARRRAEEARQMAEAEDVKRRAEEKVKRKAEEAHARKRAEEEHARRKTEDDYAKKEIQGYFDVFELPYSANFDDVKKKYKIMIRLFHPDKHSSDDTIRDYANKKTQEINEAFAALKKYFDNKKY